MSVIEKIVVENNAMSLVARGCVIASPCRTKVAEQLLEIGEKAGVVGLTGAAIKDLADKMTSDELDYLVTLEMMGNVTFLSEINDDKKEPEVQVRYYISSAYLSAEKFSLVMRGHWRIENKLHGRLYVGRNDDT